MLAFSAGLLLTVARAATELEAPWTSVTTGLGTSPLGGASFVNGRYFAIGIGTGAVSVDGITWTTFQAPALAGMRGGKVAFGKGLYVAGGGSTTDNIYVSADGTTWTSARSGMNGIAHRVLFDGDRFIAVGDPAGAGEIVTSEDGQTWTKRYSQTNASLVDITFGGGHYVAVGGAIATSADGLSWTALAAPSVPFAAVAYGDGRFVALAASNTASEIWTSSDGTSWSKRDVALPDGEPLPASAAHDVSFGAGYFVAAVRDNLLVSADGLNWRVKPGVFAPQTNYPISLGYGNGRFLSAGEAGTVLLSPPVTGAPMITAVSAPAYVRAGQSATFTVMATGANGYQWYRGESGDTSTPVAGATMATFVSPALQAEASYWARATSPVGTADSATVIVRVATSPTISVDQRDYEVVGGEPFALEAHVTGEPAPEVQWYVGRRGDISRPMADGTQPTLTVVPGEAIEYYWARAANLAGAAELEEVEVIPWTRIAELPLLNDARVLNGALVGVSAERIYTSSDGATWTDLAIVSNSYMRAIDYGAGLYIAVADRGIYSSPDLINWTARNVGGDGYPGLTGVAYGGGVFVAVGINSFVSANGVDWSAIELPTGVRLDAVVFDGSRFVATGMVNEWNNENRTELGVVFTSPDGRSWTRRAQDILPENPAQARTRLEQLVFAGGKYVASSSGASMVLVSSDAVHWTRVNLAAPAGGQLHQLAYAGGRYLLGTKGPAYFVSKDALAWTAIAAPFVSVDTILTVTPGGELLAVGSQTHGSGLAYRLNENLEWKWVAGSVSTPNLGIAKVVDGAGQAMGFHHGGIVVSLDGQNWQLTSTRFVGMGLSDLAYFRGFYYVPSPQDAGSVMASRDGRVWTSRLITPDSAAFSRLTVAGDRLFALDGNSGRLAMTTDGEHWTVREVPGLTNLYHLVEGNGTLVVGGAGADGASVRLSTDGVTWRAPAEGPMTTGVNGLTYGNGLFVAWGYQDAQASIFTSPTGEVWTSRGLPSWDGRSFQLASVVFASGRFFLETTDGIAVSDDGLTWRAGPSIGDISYPIWPVNGRVVSRRLIRALDPAATAIRTISTDQEVTAGGSTTLAVETTGADLRYQWYEGTAGDRDAPVAGATSATFTTPPVVGSGRRFWVHVMGADGAVESRAVLVAPKGPPVITRHPFPVDLPDVSYNESAVLSVEVQPPSRTTYQWYLGESGDTSAPVRDAVGPTIAPPDLPRTARYWVRIRNALGSTDSRAVQVTPWAREIGPQPSSNVSLPLSGVAHGLGTWVLTGIRIGQPGSTLLGGGVATSSDGETWTVTESPRLEVVAFGADRFVATSSALSTWRTLFVSINGRDWTSAYEDAAAVHFVDLLHGSGKFVALDEWGRVASSADGVTWTSVDVAEQLSGVAYGSDRFVACGPGGKLYTSADATTWAEVSSGVTQDISSIAYGAGSFFAVLADGSMLGSGDGQTWRPMTIQVWDGSTELATRARIRFVHDRFFAVGDNSATALTSVDGVNWGASIPAIAFAYGDGRFIGVKGEYLYRSRLAAGLAFVAAPVGQAALPGREVTFTATVAGDASLSYQWRKNGAALVDGNGVTGSRSSTLTIAEAAGVDAGQYDVVVTANGEQLTSAPANLTVLTAPIVTLQPVNRSAGVGGSLTLTGTASANGGGSVAAQWRHNGATIAGATATSLMLADLQPRDAGVYQLIFDEGATATDFAIVGLNSNAKVVGSGEEVGRNIVHPNGNIYDQVLISGTSVTVAADPGQVLRASFVDLTDDIVQVEFSGPGTLTLLLDAASGPAVATRYNQPGVQYMRGHPAIIITSATQATNLAVFSVGRLTAYNQGLFRADTEYDGVADLAFVAIASADGKFGGLRTANAHYFNDRGLTGVFAPGVEFSGPVYVGDLTAFDRAEPVLRLGTATVTKITGGDMRQANGAPVRVSGVARLEFTDGTSSHGVRWPAQRNQARFEENGSDVTDQIVIAPE